MKTPNRVVITISGDGYRTQVFDGEKEMSNRLMVMDGPNTARGSSIGKEGDIYDDLDNFEELADEIESIDLGVFSIAGELFKLNDF